MSGWGPESGAKCEGSGVRMGWGRRGDETSNSKLQIPKKLQKGKAKSEKARKRKRGDRKGLKAEG